MKHALRTREFLNEFFSLPVPAALLALTIVLLFGSLSKAASSGTLILTGIVGAQYNLVVTPNSSASALDILNGESAKLVASVNEKANNPLGYKIKMSSANGGLLKNGTIDSVAYTLSYNNATAVTPGTTAQVVKTSTSAAPAGVNSDVKVSITAYGTALAGTYSDTVTFSIEAP